MNNGGGCWTKLKLSDASGSSRFAPGTGSVNMPTDRNATHYYNMDHKHRGKALIFNHETFTIKVNGEVSPVRRGTRRDAESLALILNNLDFDVVVYLDLKYDTIMQHVHNAAKFDHTDYDCFAMVVLSHGDANNVLYACDRAYDIEDLWTPFSGDFCTTLAGKPKLFFIQACQGDKLMPPVILRQTETDGPGATYMIPSKTDFMFAYSTIPGYYSWRTPGRGSWFIEALCIELGEESNICNYDLLTILTFVNRRVAIDYKSHVPTNPKFEGRKQMPSISSRLIRLVKFNKKGEKLENAIGGQSVNGSIKIGMQNLKLTEKSEKFVVIENDDLNELQRSTSSISQASTSVTSSQLISTNYTHKTTSQLNKRDRSLQNSTQRETEKIGEYASYGKHIAQELEELPREMAIHCKKIINEAIYQAQRGALTPQ